MEILTRPALAPLHYDTTRRRLWIMGQRCHHGATGAMLTGLGAGGLASTWLTLWSGFALAGTGGLLMAHDWKDRSLWFELGPGSQP